jgi:hypothetical protein
MATSKYDESTGKVEDIDLIDLFSPSEGEITQRYGRIGQGKTYGATADVLDELRRGHVVYVNWKFNFDGIDQRKDIVYILGSLLFPWHSRFYNFPRENLRYIAVDEHFLDTFEKITDASVYLDEGHVVFDSYEMAKMSMRKRVAVLHTRHFNRSINIISQRPTAVHRMMRANVNVFYKYEKILTWPFIVFRRTEFEDMIDESVDESNPSSVKLYIGKKEIYQMYDSKYLRGDTPPSQQVKFQAFDLNYFQRITLLFRYFSK